MADGDFRNGPKALTRVKMLTIESHVEQLSKGQTADKLDAAAALGDFPTLLNEVWRPEVLRVALDTGAWDALLGVLLAAQEAAAQQQKAVDLGNEELGVQEAVIKAMARLLHCPDAGSSASAQGYFRKLAKKMVRGGALEQLSYLLTRSADSASLLALAQLVAALSRCVTAVNAVSLLNSGLLSSTISAVIQTSYEDQICDSATLAVSLLQLTASSPSACKSVFKEGLFKALTVLYKRSINPALSSDLVAPSDVCGLLLTALAVEPWNHQTKDMTKAAFHKFLMRQLVDSSALDSLVSYIVVEGYGLRRALHGAAQSGLEHLNVLVERNREESSHAELRIENLRHQRRETAAEIVLATPKSSSRKKRHDPDGLEDEKAAMLEGLLAKKKIIKSELGSHRQTVMQLKAQIRPLEVAMARLEDFVDANAIIPDNVKVGRPNLDVLRQVLTTVLRLTRVPETSDKTPDPVVAELTSSVHAKLISAGLLPACLEVCDALGAAQGLVEVLAGLTSSLGLGNALAASVSQTTRLLRGDVKRLERSRADLTMRRQQAYDELHLVTKGLEIAPPHSLTGRYTPLKDGNAMATGVRQSDLFVRQEELQQENYELDVALADVERVSSSLSAMIEILRAQKADVLAADALVPRPPPPPPPEADPNSSPPTSPRPANDVVVVPSSPFGAPGDQGAALGDESHPLSEMVSKLFVGLQPIADAALACAELEQALQPPADSQLAVSVRKALASSAGAGFGGGGGGSQPGSPMAATPTRVGKLAAASTSGRASPTSGLAGGIRGASGARSSPTSASGAPPAPPSAVAGLSMYELLQNTQSPMRGNHPASPANRPASAGARYQAGQREPYSDDIIAEASGGGGDDSSQFGGGDAVMAAARMQQLRAASARAGGAATLSGGTTGRTKLVMDTAMALQDVRSSLLFHPQGGSRVPLLDALSHQTVHLTGLLTSIAKLGATVKSLTKQARALPSSISYSSMDSFELEKRVPQLFSMLVSAMDAHPHQREAAANTIASIASMGVVDADDFEPVYVKTGIIAALMRMLGAGPVAPAEDSPEKRSPPIHARGTMPPTLRLSSNQLAGRQAAAFALQEVAEKHPAALEAISMEAGALPGCVKLCLDHSMAWEARMACASLLAKLVLAGGGLATVAVNCGCFLALLETLDRESYPYMRQGGSGGKASVVKALAFMASQDELRESVAQQIQNAVVDDIASPGNPSGAYRPSDVYQGGPDGLEDEDNMRKASGAVLRSVLKSLWNVIKQVQTLMADKRTGQGRYVNAELMAPLMTTATAAASSLAGLADGSPEARAMLRGMGVKAFLTPVHVRAVKDAALSEAMADLASKLGM